VAKQSIQKAIKKKKKGSLSEKALNLFNILGYTDKQDPLIVKADLFRTVELSQSDAALSSLARITRETNKVFPMPVLIIFRYGNHLTISVINRRLYKRDTQKDTLEKVTLIKDISIENPHRAHIEILVDLSYQELLRIHKFSNFVELYDA